MADTEIIQYCFELANALIALVSFGIGTFFAHMLWSVLNDR